MRDHQPGSKYVEVAPRFVRDEPRLFALLVELCDVALSRHESCERVRNRSVRQADCVAGELHAMPCLRLPGNLDINDRRIAADQTFAVDLHPELHAIDFRDALVLDHSPGDAKILAEHSPALDIAMRLLRAGAPVEILLVEVPAGAMNNRSEPAAALEDVVADILEVGESGVVNHTRNARNDDSRLAIRVRRAIESKVHGRTSSR